MLDSPEVNAFALPGGYVYVTRGIMAYLDSEADLAGLPTQRDVLNSRFGVPGAYNTGLLGYLEGVRS